MRTPVLLLLDNLLSEDTVGIRQALVTMLEELPEPVRAPLPPLPQAPAYPHHVYPFLAAYLQTFPHKAAVASTSQKDLPLHFAASSGDATICQMVWQAVSR